MRRFSLLLVVLIDWLGVSAVSLAQSALQIAAGPTSSEVFPIAASLAHALDKSGIGTRVLLRATRRTSEGLELVLNGKADISVASSELTWSTLEERGVNGDASGLRMLAVVDPHHIALIAARGSGLNAPADLRGKKVRIGEAGKPTAIHARRVLAAAGIDADRDITIVDIATDYQDLEASLEEKKIDAFFHLGRLEELRPSHYNVKDALELVLLDLSPLAGALRAAHGPIYGSAMLPANVFKGIEREVPGVALWRQVVISAAMADATAARIATALVWNGQLLSKIVAKGAGIELSQQRVGRSVLPFHPGAAAAYSGHGERLSD